MINRGNTGNNILKNIRNTSKRKDSTNWQWRGYSNKQMMRDNKELIKRYKMRSKEKQHTMTMYKSRRREKTSSKSKATYLWKRLEIYSRLRLDNSSWKKSILKFKNNSD